jgi:hypothetical protein
VFAATFFAQTRQVPSLLTMQAPTGLAGMQAFRNRGHWLGLIFPTITWWHWQPVWMSLPCVSLRLYFLRASYSMSVSLSCKAESSSRPMPRQLPAVTLKALCITSKAFLLPSGFTTFTVQSHPRLHTLLHIFGANIHLDFSGNRCHIEDHKFLQNKSPITFRKTRF